MADIEVAFDNDLSKLVADKLLTSGEAIALQTLREVQAQADANVEVKKNTVTIVPTARRR